MREPAREPACEPLPSAEVARAAPAPSALSAPSAPSASAAGTPAIPPVPLPAPESVAFPPPAADPSVALEATRIVRKSTAFHVLLEGAAGSFILGRGDHAIGRVPGSAVYIQTLDVSPRHARIRIEDDTATVEDLQSGNGTFVNGRRLAAPERLSDGDELSFGDLKFRVRFARPADPARKK